MSLYSTKKIIKSQPWSGFERKNGEKRDRSLSIIEEKNIGGYFSIHIEVIPHPCLSADRGAGRPLLLSSLFTIFPLIFDKDPIVFYFLLITLLSTILCPPQPYPSRHHTVDQKEL